MKQLLVVVALALVTSTAAADHPPKPSAPVTVRIDSVSVPGGYQVRLVAVPTRTVPSVVLTLAGKQIAFGPTTAGQSRELVTTIAYRPGDSIDIIGTAIVAGRNRVASTHVGVQQLRKANNVVTRTLPDGRRVSEAR